MVAPDPELSAHPKPDRRLVAGGHRHLRENIAAIVALESPIVLLGTGAPAISRAALMRR
jgi:hypothetical protein